MKNVRCLLLVVWAMALLVSANAQTYNVTDFSAVNNPHGVWSYGSIPSLGGPFTLLTKKITIQDNYYNLAHWMLYDEAPYYPAVVANLSSAPNTTWAINPLPVGAVGMHPSILSDMAVIRFTSPENAFYDLSFTFDGLGRATVVAYVYHGTTQLFLAHLNQNGGSDTASYSTTNRFIGAGQTIDLIAGHGNDRGAWTHYYDGTRVSGSLQRILGIDSLGGSSLPEPGTLAMLTGAGIAASLLVLRRRRA